MEKTKITKEDVVRFIAEDWRELTQKQLDSFDCNEGRKAMVSDAIDITSRATYQSETTIDKTYLILLESFGTMLNRYVDSIAKKL